MKRIYYLPIAFINRTAALFLAAIMMCCVTVKAQPYHIDFSAHPPPVLTTDPSLDQNDHIGPPFVPEDAIEVGVRFRVTQPGFITGIRFYKGDGVAGTHIGHLWTNTGTQLAQATFVGETANGWQEVAINVHINAGVNYVASVFSNVGDYAAEPPGSYNWNVNGPPPNDAPNDFGAPPVKVIRASNDPGGNGIFSYLFNATSPNGAFPANATVNAVNFWIDVTFAPDFALPVSLADFKATPVNNAISLAWKTDHEFNNKGFEIQRSNNGSDWYAINFINGTGESTVTRNYNYTDRALAPGTYYYRLNQKDMDGKSTYSAIASATISGKGIVSLFQNYPNPFTSITSIRFDLPRTQHARLSLLDMSGRELKVLTDKVGEAGSHVITLDATSFVRQTYLIRLQTDNGIITRKIVVR